MAMHSKSASAITRSKRIAPTVQIILPSTVETLTKGEK